MVGDPSPDGRIYASARDVTKQKELEQQLREQATTDPLSGLRNRRQFEEAGRQLAQARRYGAPLALLMIDLDGFKAVNDRIGHHAGDQVIACVGEQLRLRLRASDLAGRFGADEFAVLLPHAAAAQAAATAEALLERIQECGWHGEGVEMPISASIGIAVYAPDSPEELDQLVRRADAAMREAKRSGSARYIVESSGATASGE